MIQFEDKRAQRVFDQYCKQINAITRPLSANDREEVIREITSHIYESISADSGKDEVENLLNAIDKLGDINEYLSPIVADKLIKEAGKDLNPKTMIRAYVHNLGHSFKRSLLFSLFGIFYLILACIVVAAVLKLFIPDMGLYVGKGMFFLGILHKPEAVEVLGYWLVPIGLTIAVVLYIISSKVLKYLTLKN